MNEQSFYQDLQDQNGPQLLNEIDFTFIEKGNSEIPGLQADQTLSDQEPFLVEYYYQKAHMNHHYCLYITNYRVLLQYEESPPKYRSIPLGYLCGTEVIQNCLVLKNGMKLCIDQLVSKWTLRKKLKQAFSKFPSCYPRQGFQNATQIYDTLAQIERMRIRWKKYLIVQNKGGCICITYPQYVIVPKEVSSQLLAESIKHWNMGRVPILAFHHSATEACIWRSARMRAGRGDWQAFTDSYLQAISGNYALIDIIERQKLTFKTTETKRKQSSGSAKDNGFQFSFQSLASLREIYEQMLVNYVKMEHQQNTPKPIKLTESLIRFREAYEHMVPTVSKIQGFSKYLSKWYEDVNLLLTCAYTIAAYLHKGQHVLVQQLYALDRVPQVIALATILIDPYYRTIRGFGVLVEKEFVSHGHPFATRLGFKRDKPEEWSPIFVEFLEAVHQLVTAHPSHFQYSGEYLARIGYQVYTRKYCNFEKVEPYQHHSNCSKSSKSIWVHMPMAKTFYNYQKKQLSSVQLPDVRKKPSIKQYLLWKEYLDAVGFFTLDKLGPSDPQKQLFELVSARQKNR